MSRVGPQWVPATVICRQAWAMPSADRPRSASSSSRSPCSTNRSGMPSRLHAGCRVSEVAGGLQHRAAETSHQGTFFDRDNDRAFAQCSLQQLAIQRLDEPAIHYAEVQSLVMQQVGRFERLVNQRTTGQDDAVRSPTQDLGTSQFERRSWLGKRVGGALGVADRTGGVASAARSRAWFPES